MSVLQNRQVRELVGLSRAQFNATVKIQNQILRSQLWLAVVGGLSVYLPEGTLAYLGGLVSLLIAAWWAWLSWKAKTSRALAEGARRTAFLVHGFGNDLAPALFANFAARFSLPDGDAQAAQDSNYFETNAPPGYQRLAEMLEEASFWSGNLLRAELNRLIFWFLVFAFALSIGLLAVQPTLEAGSWQGIARVVFCGFMLLASSDILGSALMTYQSSLDASRVAERLASIPKPAITPQDFITLWSDYCSAVESAPVIDDATHRRESGRLNKLWQNRHAP